MKIEIGLDEQGFKGKILEYLHKRLGKNINENVIGHLEKKRYISELYQDYINGKLMQNDSLIDGAMDGFVEEYEDLEKLTGKQDKSPRTKAAETIMDSLSPKTVKYFKCISAILAKEAEQLSVVRNFRQSFLQESNNYLLKSEEIGSWLLSKGTSIYNHNTCPYGGIDYYSLQRMVAPRTTAVDDLDDEICITKKKLKSLFYYDGKGWIAVKSDSTPLKELRHVVHHLQMRYRWWDEPDIVELVLSGKMPTIMGIDGTIEGHAEHYIDSYEKVNKRRKNAIHIVTNMRADLVNQKISLEISPILSPEEVKKIYREARCHLFKSKQLHLIRDKSLALIIFCAEHDIGLPWEELRKKWDEMHGIGNEAEVDGKRRSKGKKRKWIYGDKMGSAKIFSRDVRKAWKKIRGLPYLPSKKKSDFSIDDLKGELPNVTHLYDSL